jgi:hypothetical protein
MLCALPGQGRSATAAPWGVAIFNPLYEREQQGGTGSMWESRDIMPGGARQPSGTHPENHFQERTHGARMLRQTLTEFRMAEDHQWQTHTNGGTSLKDHVKWNIPP